ncbi:546_t:CDS:2 [Funneliformis mosseae]|uniref:546_t:CDS:1 n=1 Tax=Funneliformis mosseae TaxID=27381 RepID=A0A9N8VP48_FUNMO|nr:546_t:CDS:2 [Funneliformis mosseae]
MTKKIRKPRNKATLSSSANSATEPPFNPIDNSSSSRNEKPHSGGNNKVIFVTTPSNNNQIGWGSTSHSFLFTIAKNDLNSGYIARVSKDIEIQKNAIYYKSDFGPAFGNLSIIDKSIHRNNDPEF